MTTLFFLTSASSAIGAVLTVIFQAYLAQYTREAIAEENAELRRALTYMEIKLDEFKNALDSQGGLLDKIATNAFDAAYNTKQITRKLSEHDKNSNNEKA